MNHLSKNGLNLKIDDSSKKIYFQMVCLLRDNLGLNQICGFVESFTAEYYCRICRMSSEENRVISVERLEKKLTVKNYEND